MKVYKYIKGKIEVDYFFVKGHLDIDPEYYIKKIEEAPRSDHISNIVGFKTERKYFLHDKIFFKQIMVPILNLLLEENFNRHFFFSRSVGFKRGFC